MENIDIKKFIEAVEQQPVEKTYSQNKENIYESGNLMRYGKIKDLDYGETDTYLTDATMESLKEILGEKLKFLKLTRHEQYQKQDQLDKLNKDEYIWKTTTKRTVHDPNVCHKLYPDGYRKFKDNIQHFIFPDGESITRRELQNYLPFKACSLIRGLSDNLILSGHKVFIKLAEMSDQDIYQILKSIEISVIFNDICRIILKKAHDNTFNKIIRESKKFQDVVRNNILTAKLESVERDYRVVLALYLINLVMTHFDEKHKLHFDYQSLGKIVSRRLKKNEILYNSSNSWWRQHCNCVRSIMIAMLNSNVFGIEYDKIMIKEKPKTHIKFVVPLHLANNNVNYTRFPRIYKAPPLDKDSFLDRIKPIFKGEVTISFSDKFRRTLDISQNKRYTINVTFLNLLKKLYNLNNMSIYYKSFEGAVLPFDFDPTIREVVSNARNLEKVSAVDSLTRHIVEQIRMTRAGKGHTTPLSYAQCLLVAGHSSMEIIINSKKEK